MQEARRTQVPPGRSVTAMSPALTCGDTPRIEPAAWRLQITRLLDQPLTLSRHDPMSLPRERPTAGLHRVTRPVMDEDKPGSRDLPGYHVYGEPRKEERHGWAW